MNEFEKNQDKGTQTGEQGDKPAFGQLDTEKGQGQQEQGQTGQQQYGQKGEQLNPGQQEQGQGTQREELADIDQQGDQGTTEKGQDDQQR